MKKDDLLEKEFDPFIDNHKKKTKELNIEETKKTKKTKKKVLKFNKRKANKGFNSFDSVDLALVVVFIAFLVLTIFLGYKVNLAKKEYKDYVKASIVVPVLGSNTNNNISVDISKMKKGEEKDYSFKVANNKDGNINPEEVIYGLQLLDAESAIVEVYKNEDTENILPENNIILDNKLAANKEQVDKYTLKIKAKKATGDKQLITIRIVS